MKRAAVSLLFILAVLTAFAQSSATTLYVAVKNINIKASSGFFARVIETLAQGDAVTLIQSRDKWLIVRSKKGAEGWVPADAFTARRVVRSAAGVPATEYAMAGKGFNSDLEKVLGASGEINYTGVDAMEKRKVSPEELKSFLQEGRLAEGD